MSARLFTPTNQIRLTNVVVVRQKKGGKRFELACFPNKVASWRSNIEKDLDEVLQTPAIFSNVSKGAVAKKADIVKAYGTDDENAVIIEILTKGEVQVSHEERQANLESTFREIATIVADKCVNPDTNRPYTSAQIERTMHDIHFSVKPTQSTKQQALEVIRLLKETIPIERAKMSLRFVLPKKEAKAVRALIAKLATDLSEDWVAEGLELECSVDPGNFRELDEMVRRETKGRAQIEILSVKNVEGGDQAL